MVVLEKAEDFHRHVDGCVVCTTGCREAIFCVRGWRLLLGVMDEAFALAERGVAANLAAPTLPAVMPSPAGDSRRTVRKPANGVTVAAEQLRGRMDGLDRKSKESSQKLASDDTGGTLEGATTS
jgi:hypothetical protein